MIEIHFGSSIILTDCTQVKMKSSVLRRNSKNSISSGSVKYVPIESEKFVDNFRSDSHKEKKKQLDNDEVDNDDTGEKAKSASTGLITDETISHSSSSSVSSVYSSVSSLSGNDEDSLMGVNFSFMKNVHDSATTARSPLIVHKKIKGTISSPLLGNNEGTIFRRPCVISSASQTEGKPSTQQLTPLRHNHMDMRPPRTLYSTNGNVKRIPKISHSYQNIYPQPTLPSTLTKNNVKTPRIPPPLSRERSRESTISPVQHHRVVSNGSLLSENSHSNLSFPMVGYSSDLDNTACSSTQLPQEEQESEVRHAHRSRKKKNFVKQEMKYFLNKFKLSKLRSSRVKLLRSKHGCLT